MQTKAGEAPGTLEVTTARGVTIVCRKVNTLPLTSLMIKLSAGNKDLADANSQDEVRAAIVKNGLRSSQTRSVMGIMNYCFGYGIVTDPPKEMAEMLVEMGLSSENQRSVRAAWVLHEVVEDEAEAWELCKAIMSMSSTADED